ncbi:Mor transcription activator family protein [Pseudodesulfovibrio pelocollis]|uniref:Mor transcription activator family protein n=1 Tax=Pseudodesulfovibrio pelocollis TaxID=3051432 RepID=UPI00255B1F42|nr:Mor transcription activator family protein [Pseudodesulfovibrio sp. SB368]
MDNPRTVGTEFLMELAEIIAELAQGTLGIPKDQADKFGQEASAAIADSWGGQILYIPKDKTGKLARRDAEIYTRFRGENASELAAEFDLSVQQIYRIIARERAARRQKQFSLLDG